MRHGEYAEARQWLLRAVQERPDDADALQSLGVALAETGDLEAAVEQFHKAVEKGGHSVALHENLARALTDLMPRVGHVKLLRQWAGCYDVTPDHSPILGETPGIAGLLQMSGFVGHGFMMAPAVGRRMALWMGGAEDEIFARYNLSRFAEGNLIEETFIIG